MTGYELATPGVVAEKFQEGLVVLNLDTGEYFDVGERTVPLLDALFQGLGAAALQNALEAREPGAAQQVSDALGKLTDFGVLRAAPATNDVVDPAHCDAILSSGTYFHIECHSDLAELIAADPIHDLDHVTGKKT